MAAEVTIDSLLIEVDSDANSAMQGLENLVNRLEKLKAAVSPITGGNSGFTKLQKQLQQLKQTTAELQNITGIDKLTQLAEALRDFSNVSGNTNLNPLINSLRRIPEMVSAISAMPNIDPSRIASLVSALAPLQALGGRSNLNSFINSLRRIPEIAQDLQNTDIDTFSQEIQRLTDAMRPLAEEMAQVAQGFSALSPEIQRYVRQSEGASSGTRTLSTTLGDLKVKTLAALATFRKLYSVLADCFEASNQFVENLNLFTVTMGESADEAYAFAEAVNEALGIDTSDWIRYQGFFQSIAKGFGTTAEQADLMSQNLTQLSYDIASFYNVSVEEAYNKVVSGFSGELEPLRRLGFALDEATLKQFAYSKGIEQSVESMTQAQKGQLRYVAMIEQAGSIGVLGDMSRTIDTAANGLRILQARVQQFARAVGDVVAPVLSAVLPYLTAFVQLMTEAANELAALFGFELPEIDLSAAAVTGGFDDITAAVDDATGAVEEFKGSLAGVDQLNIIGSTSEAGGNGEATGAFDLGIELPTYDFLGDVQSETKAIFESMKDGLREVLPWIEAVGAAIAGLYVGNGLINVVTWIGKLADKFKALKAVVGAKGASNLFGVAGGLATGASSGVLFYNSIKNLITGTGNLKNNIAQLVAGIGIAAGAIAAFIALGNPVGAVITGIGALIGATIGLIAGCNEEIEKNNEIIISNALYRNGGTKISEIATAFTKWADAASEVNRETIDKYKQLDTYEQQISDTLDVLNELGGINIDLNTLTSADAEALKEPFNELVTYLQENFTASCETVADDLRMAFTNLGIQSAVSEEVTAAYSDMQRLFNDNLTESQKAVDTYLTKIAEGGTLTQTEQADFYTKYNYVIDTARGQDSTYVEVQSALKDLQNLDLSTINFETDTTAREAVKDMEDALKAYSDNAKLLYEEEVKNLDQLRVQAGVELKYGNITQAEYDKQMKLLDFSEAIFALNYNKSIEDILAQIEPVMSKMEEQLGDAARELTPSIVDWFQAATYTSLTGYADYGPSRYDVERVAQELAAGGWLEDNATYQAIQEYNSYASTLMLDIDSNLDPDVQRLIDAENGTPLEVPVKLVYYGENDQYLREFLASSAVPTFEEVKPDVNAPTVTLPDVMRSTPSIRGSVSEAFAQYTAQVVGGADKDVNLTVPVTVEMDGDAVGEAVARYNLKNAFLSNGR